jgi:hypothetical protein
MKYHIKYHTNSNTGMLYIAVILLKLPI